MSGTRYRRGILVSCQLPWSDDERLQENVFRREVQWLRAAGFRDVYVFGTAGEGYAVDRAAFDQVVGIFAEETAGNDLCPQVGAIGLSTAQVRDRLALAYRRGFRTFQISLPNWGALNDGEVLRFFHDVCDAFPDCRFLHYNVARSKRLLVPRDYRRLAGEIPNLVATKNTAPNVYLAAGLMREAAELQHFFGEATFPIGCLFGECSLLSSFGPVAPLRTREFFDAGCNGEWARMARFHKEYLSAMEDVLAPMREGEWMDGAYDKVILRLGGCEMPLRLASPYSGFPEQVYEQCRAVLRDRYGEWAR